MFSYLVHGQSMKLIKQVHCNLGNKAWEFGDMFVFSDMTLATLFCVCKYIVWTAK